MDLGRGEVRLWLARVAPGDVVPAPPGLLVMRGRDDVLVEQQAGRRIEGPAVALVWQLETARPEWART